MTPPGTLQVRVVEVIRETSDAHSLVLEPVDQDRGLSYRPGQFVTVRVPSTRTTGAARCYSLCSSPLCDEPPKITVKRTADGYASNWLCDNVTAGSTLEILRPAGRFTPDSLDEDFVLLAGGSGITPVMSILKSCLSAGTGSVTLIYANRDENSVIFRDELNTLAKEYPDRLTVVHWLESVQGIPDVGWLRALIAPHLEKQAFICGPGPFMDLAVTTLDTLGMPADRVHTERFTSLDSDPFAEHVNDTWSDGPAATVEVELDGECRQVTWPTGSALLDVLLESGMDAPFSCREGACSACACVLVEGEVAMRRNEVLDEQDIADGLILACQAVPVSEQVRITYDG